MKRVLGIAASAAALLIAGAGSAATVIVNVMVDLNSSATHLSGGSGTVSDPFTNLIVQASTLSSPQKITDGDTLKYVITFAGNEAITVSDPDSFTMRLQAVSGSTNTPTSTTGKISLLGTSYASSTATSTSSDSVTGSVDADAKFSSNPSDANYLPDPVTFTGLEWDGTVDYTNYSGNTFYKMFDSPSFSLSADIISVSGGVPEPASWAMMLVGFGAIGGALRSRRAANAKVTFA